jgi:hypothetical protein
LLVWAISAGVAQAQSEPAISIPAIRVLDKQYREYRIGDDFKVNLSAADLKQAGGASALRLRIVRGSRVDLLGSLRYPASDGCLIYKSSFFLAQEYNGGLRVQFLDKRAVVFTNRWLSSGAGDKLADQHFVLVLERGGTEAKEILKLRPEDAEAYFDKGFEFVVKSPQRPPQPSLIARLFEQEKVDRVTSGAEVAAIAREAPPRTRCLVFSPLSFAGEMTLIAERCAPSAEVEGEEIQQVAFGGELRGSGGAVRLNLGDP